MLDKYEKKLRKKVKESEKSFDDFCEERKIDINIALDDSKKSVKSDKHIKMRRISTIITTTAALAIVMVVLLVNYLPILPPSIPPKMYDDLNINLTDSNLTELNTYLENADFGILDGLSIQCGKSKDTGLPIYFTTAGHFEAANYFELDITYVLTNNYAPTWIKDYAALSGNIDLGENYTIKYQFDKRDNDFYLYLVKVNYKSSVFYIRMLSFFDEGIEDFLKTLFF